MTERSVFDQISANLKLLYTINGIHGTRWLIISGMQSPPTGVASEPFGHDPSVKKRIGTSWAASNIGCNIESILGGNDSPLSCLLLLLAYRYYFVIYKYAHILYIEAKRNTFGQANLFYLQYVLYVKLNRHATVFLLIQSLDKLSYILVWYLFSCIHAYPQKVCLASWHPI